jgi:iron complex outermembrane receptor protein
MAINISTWSVKSVGGDVTKGFMRRHHRALLVTATLFASGSWAAPSLAQEQPEADNVSGLQDIVVTARRREENLQDTPVSVVAFTGEALAERQVVNVADIGNFTPNLIIDSASALGGSSSTISAFIRGVGQSDFNLTIDPGVGLYLDGVYISRSVGSLLDTVDLARVEVLRGPQGTLFGKNTIGGAVVLVSEQPDNDFAGRIEAITGSFNRIDLRGMLNIPVSDRLAVRLTASSQDRDGYYDRLQDGDRMGNRNSLSGRLQVAWEPTDTLTLSLSADGTRVREEGKPLTLLAVNPAADFAGFWNFAVNGATCFTPPAGLPVPNEPECFNDQWITDDVRSTNTTGANFSDLDLWGTSLTIDWALGAVDFKSITAYRDLESAFFQDYDGSPLPIGETGNVYTQTQFSQEFQFSGSAIDDRLNWLLGLYYLKENGTDINSLTFSVADFISGGSVENDSYAAFSQVGFAITDQLSLTVGARYTHETKRFRPDQFIQVDRTGGTLLALSELFIPTGNPDGNLILPRTEASITDKEFTPAVALDYKLTDDVLLYASYSKGFKSGGFTQRVFPPEAVVPAFGPERATAYEIGLKNNLFNRRLRLNLAAFQTDYTGLQIIVNEGIAPKVRNAGEARIRGFEIEAEAVLSDAVQISAGVGYTDAEYLEVDPAAVGITADNQFGNVPAWTATAGVSADLFKIAEGQVSSRVDWSFRSAHFKDAINTPELRQPAYSLFNATLTYRAKNDRWGLTAGVTNLFDKTYLVTGYNDIVGIGVITGTYARPREFLASANFTF